MIITYIRFFIVTVAGFMGWAVATLEAINIYNNIIEASTYGMAAPIEHIVYLYIMFIAMLSIVVGYPYVVLSAVYYNGIKVHREEIKNDKQ